MQSPLVQLFNQTACLSPIYPAYWENAYKTCTDKINDVCSYFLVNKDAIKISEECMIQSLYKQLPSTSTFSSESLEKISNSTLNALYSNSKNLRNHCTQFSRFMSSFYEEVEKDTEMTSLVSSASDAISTIFAGINANFFSEDLC